MIEVLFFLEWDDQAFDDAVVLDVLGEDRFHVVFGFGCIPDVVGVDDQGRSLRAGVEASCLVDAYFTFQAAVVDAFFKIVQKFG